MLSFDFVVLNQVGSLVRASQIVDLVVLVPDWALASVKLSESQLNSVLKHHFWSTKIRVTQ